MDNGIVTFADKKEYIESAVALSVTAKKFNTLPVCLVTTKDAMPVAVEYQNYFDKILVLDNADTDYNLIRALEESPYNKTLFLYSDSIVTANISPVFELLSIFSMVFPRATDFKGLPVSSELYDNRKIITKNSLPDIWTSAILYDKSESSKRVLARAKNVYSNWTVYKNNIAKEYNLENGLTSKFNTIISMSVYLEDEPVPDTSFAFSNLSKQPNNLFIKSSATMDWFTYLGFWITDESKFKVENYIQQGIVHTTSAFPAKEYLQRINEVCRR
jgi:hypothetical protein